MFQHLGFLIEINKKLAKNVRSKTSFFLGGGYLRYKKLCKNNDVKFSFDLGKKKIFFRVN